MQEASTPSSDSKFEPLSRAQFVEKMEAFLQGGNENILTPITPQLLYQLITTHQEIAEELLFYPVFHGVNVPENDDSRRAKMLIFLCILLQTYEAPDGSKPGQKWIKTLLQKRTETNAKTVLHVAAQRQHSPLLILYLLELAESSKITDYVNIKDHPELGLGITPLFSAADAIQVDNFRILLENRANSFFKHPILGTVYDVLIQKAGHPKTVAAIELLHDHSPAFKKSLTPYLKVMTSPSTPKRLKQESAQESKSPKTPKTSKTSTVRDVIRNRMLFDLARSANANLSLFVAFLETTSRTFTLAEQNDEEGVGQRLQQRFLQDFDQVEPDFLRMAREGVLKIDEKEQIEIFSAACWLMNQRRPLAALALFQRLLADKNSIFLKNTAQVFKLLRWSAMCIGQIHQKNQPKNTKQIESYLKEVEDTSSLDELLALLQRTANEEILPSNLSLSVARLLCHFLRGQQSSLPLLQSHSTEKKRPTTLDTPLFLAETKEEEQRGWNCFDVAIGLSREALVAFAQKHKGDIFFRKLLAPEIKTASVLTAIAMNMQDENMQDALKREKDLIELFGLLCVAEQFAEKEEIKKVSLHIQETLKKPEENSDTLHDLKRLSLPSSMHKTEIQQLVNAYNDAHEAIKPELAKCNTSLGYSEGERLSLSELRDFFALPDHRTRYEPAFRIFDEASKKIMPSEKAFQDYCEREEIYEAYVNGYYGNQQWVAFIPISSGKQNTSMVDIAARCLDKKIIIHQLKEKKYEEIYRTEYEGNGIIHIQYNGHNHFIALTCNPAYFAKIGSELLTRFKFSFFKPQDASATDKSLQRDEQNEENNKITEIVLGYLG